jgi:hypothetical protein
MWVAGVKNLLPQMRFCLFLYKFLHEVMDEVQTAKITKLFVKKTRIKEL